MPVLKNNQRKSNGARRIDEARSTCGAVPIYLRIIPALADPRRDQRLFASIFILVIASLVVQGWTVGSATRLLGFARRG